MPKVFFAGDHAGFRLKEALIAHARTLGYDAEDVGPTELNAEDDYPDFVTPCAKRVAEATGSFGILVGGSGQGEAMAANRVNGIRCAIFYGPMHVTDALDVEGGRSEDGFDPIRLCRRHNDANMLSLGARFVSGVQADEAMRIFLTTEFSGAERHRRRIAKF
jgi:ribose 5-phosphate isomerase B